MAWGHSSSDSATGLDKMHSASQDAKLCQSGRSHTCPTQVELLQSLLNTFIHTRCPITYAYFLIERAFLAF